MGKAVPTKYLTLKFCLHRIISTYITLASIQRLPKSTLSPLSRPPHVLQFLIINPIVRPI